MNYSDEMCAKCQALVGSNKYRAAHSSLSQDGETKIFNAMGFRADETPYVCRDCGQRWIHEVGNSGYGWVPSRL